MSQMIQQAHSTPKEINVPLTKELFQTKCHIFQHIPHDMITWTVSQPLYKANPQHRSVIWHTNVISPFQILFKYVDIYGFAVVTFNCQVDIWVLIVMSVCSISGWVYHFLSLVWNFHPLSGYEWNAFLPGCNNQLFNAGYLKASPNKDSRHLTIIGPYKAEKSPFRIKGSLDAAICAEANCLIQGHERDFLNGTCRPKKNRTAGYIPALSSPLSFSLSLSFSLVFIT